MGMHADKLNDMAECARVQLNQQGNSNKQQHNNDDGWPSSCEIIEARGTQREKHPRGACTSKLAAISVFKMKIIDVRKAVKILSQEPMLGIAKVEPTVQLWGVCNFGGDNTGLMGLSTPDRDQIYMYTTSSTI